MPGFIPRNLLDNDPNADADPTYRMSMMPFGTYPNADGSGEHLGLAWPGMITEPVNALMRLAQNSRFEDGHLGIPNPQNLDNQHDTATLIESLFGGNATRGAGAAESAAARVLSDTGKPSALGAAVAGAERPGFDVWHGSPHDFDQFDLSKIGSGEGAQAYGHGLYFAEHPDVAKGYQEALSNDYGKNTRTLLRMTGSPDAAIEWLAKRGKQDHFSQDILNDLSRGDSPAPGYLYQARINADPEHFLDWDKAIGEQSALPRTALESLFQSHLPDTPLSPDYSATGMMNVLRKSPAEVSALLKDQGVPGIRYLDAGSRGAVDGSRNYVLFDDSLVDTLHKWQGDKQLYSDNLPSFLNPALSQDQDTPRNSLFTY